MSGRTGIGYDALGERAGEPALVIRARNVGDVVRREGGGAGSLAYSVARGTVTSKFYSTLRDEIDAAMRARGVDADVRVTSSPPEGPQPKGEFLTGMGAGAGAVGAGWALWHYLIRPFIARLT